MNVLDAILKACLQTDDFQKRRASLQGLESDRAKAQSVFAAIEESFDNLVQKFNDIPTALKEKFDDFVQSATNIPTTLGETLGELRQTFNEYTPTKIPLIQQPVIYKTAHQTSMC
jgi:hypothetical protein